jgi:predicted dehydrogenase
MDKLLERNKDRGDAGEHGISTHVRWGVLGAAGIAISKVIPAIQRSANARVVAIASRDLGKARVAAERLGIERAYGSYEELLADADVDVVYIPLPNHLHAPWTARAAEAGKHVLCEKPIALNAGEARELLRVRERTNVHIAEAFMVRAHPQWLKTRELVRGGRIGELRLITAHFSYFKTDPGNVRNRVEWGGGGLLDIGCYPVMLARWLFDTEPERVVALMERDPDLGVDRLTAGLLDFGKGQASFTVGTQLASAQRMQIFGTDGSITLDLPFNPPPDQRARIVVDAEAIEFDAVDQFTLQADAFSRAVRGEGHLLMTLDDSIANMMVLDALFRSAESGQWERL